MKRPRRRRFQVEVLEPRLCLAAPPMYPGTPIQFPQDQPWTNTPFVASPLFADLNNDGRDELIGSAAGGRLIAFNTDSNGTVQLFQVYNTGAVANIKSTPVVVTLPSGRKAIFAGLGRHEGLDGAIEDGRVFGWDAITGQLLPGWPKDPGFTFVNQYPRTAATLFGVPSGPNTVFGAGVVGPLASGDLDGDNVPEIVATSNSHFVTAFRVDGSILWRYNNDDTIASGAVIGDLDRDGRNEVVVGGDISAGPFFHAGGFINVLNGHSGTARFRIPINEVVWSSPVLADLNHDGTLEIVVGTGLNFDLANVPGARAAGNRVYAFDVNGQTVPGWPYHTTSNDAIARQTYASPAVADLNGDGSLEIIESDRGGFVHVIQSNGQALPGWEGGKPIGSPPPGENFASPIVADVDGDGAPDVIAGDHIFLAAFKADGSLIFRHTLPNGEGILNAPAVGQFDGRGGLELAVISNASGTLDRPSLVNVFQLPPSPLTPPWPLHRRSPGATAIHQSPRFLSAHVDGAYRALVGRDPAPDEKAGIVAALQANRLTPRQLDQFLVGTNEARGHTVDVLFQRYLNRGPRPEERATFAFQLLSIRERDLARGLILTGEFFGRAGGSPQQLITLLYQTILGRDPSPGNVDFVLGEIQGGRLNVVNFIDFLLDSEESLTRRVVSTYQAAFGTSDVPADALAVAVLGLRRGRREADVSAELVASGTLLAVGNQLAAYVRTLYRDLLGREASPAETANVFRLLDTGVLSPTSLVQFLVNSTEGRIQYIREQFRMLLGRDIDPALAAGLANFARREDVVALIVASDEYFFTRGGGTVQGYVIAAFRDLTTIDITQIPDQFNARVAAINSGTPRAALAIELSRSPLYFNVVAVDNLFRYLPDESAGVLRSGTGPIGVLPLINPDPGVVTALTNLLTAGAPLETVVVGLTTQPKYINNSAYFKGYFRSIGVRN